MRACTRQPQGAVRVSNAFRRPQNIILPPSVRDVAAGVSGSLNGVAKIGYGQAGTAIDITGATGTSDRFSLGSGSGIVPASFTRLHVFSVGSLSTYTPLSDSYYLYGAAQLIRVETSGAIALIASYQSVKAITETGWVTPGKVHTLVVSYDHATGDFRFALDGAKYAAGSFTPFSWNPGVDFVLGTSYASVSADHKHYLFANWNESLPLNEILALVQNPWSLFSSPRRLWIQLGAAAATTYTVTGSGTVVFSGTPAYKRLVKTITSGGITYTGAGAAKDIHSPDTSGGISYTGTAVAKKLFAPLSSGGIIFAGDAVEKLIRSALAAGGLLFGGTAGFIPVLSGGTIYTVTPSGGIVFGSSAAVKSIHDSLSQGGLAYSGIAGYNLIREILAAGGLTFAGVAGVTGPSTGTGSLDQATIDAIALAVWQRVVDAGLTAEQLLRLLVSHAAGSATGLENGAPVFKSLDGTKDRITGTYAAGTRTVTGRDAT